MGLSLGATRAFFVLGVGFAIGARDGAAPHALATTRARRVRYSPSREERQMTSERLAGRFEIIAKAGAGGMGQVYKALDHASARVVALKVLTERADDARFEREARVLASLDHPTIVLIWPTEPRRTARAGWPWSGSKEKTSPIASRAKGSASAKRSGSSSASRRRSRWRTSEASFIATSSPATSFCSADRRRTRGCSISESPEETAANAAPHAHGRDHGNARLHGPRASERALERRSPRGLYALGAVLFHAVAGVAPFRADNVMALLAKVLLEDAPRLRELRPEVDPALSWSRRCSTSSPSDAPRARESSC